MSVRIAKITLSLSTQFRAGADELSALRSTVTERAYAAYFFIKSNCYGALGPGRSTADTLAKAVAKGNTSSEISSRCV
jgi:hypothetical protein